MSYHARYRRPAMGGITDTITGAIGTVVNVASDPYLPEVICRVGQLKAIDHGEPLAVCQPAPPGVIGGVGLGRALPALRAYVYAQQHRWVYAVAAAALFGVPLLIGYELGLSSRSGGRP